MTTILRTLAMSLVLITLPAGVVANTIGDDDDSAPCDDDDSAEALPEDATTYGFLCGVGGPESVPTPALLLGAGALLLLGARRRS
ncbi:MAG: hypothetical protein KDA24_08120 [Deltaproteobacteria bacterium]|nr:hypothetical protein [Deltaproteobacteria bacterium]